MRFLLPRNGDSTATIACIRSPSAANNPALIMRRRRGSFVSTRRWQRRRSKLCPLALVELRQIKASMGVLKREREKPPKDKKKAVFVCLFPRSFQKVFWTANVTKLPLGPLSHWDDNRIRPCWDCVRGGYFAGQQFMPTGCQQAGQSLAPLFSKQSFLCIRAEAIVAC